MFNSSHLIKNVFGVANNLDMEIIKERFNSKFSEWYRQAIGEDKELAIQAYKNLINKYENIDSIDYDISIILLVDSIIIIKQGLTNDYPDLKLIKTARNLQSINNAVDNGYIPLIKEVKILTTIKAMYALDRNKETGKFIELTDSRTIWSHNEHSERIIDQAEYYPYCFESPYAAYLVPADLKTGERVVLEDLIEDYVGDTWKMNSYRLKSSEAIWTGTEFIVDYVSAPRSVSLG